MDACVARLGPPAAKMQQLYPIDVPAQAHTSVSQAQEVLMVVFRAPTQFTRCKSQRSILIIVQTILNVYSPPTPPLPPRSRRT